MFHFLGRCFQGVVCLLITAAVYSHAETTKKAAVSAEIREGPWGKLVCHEAYLEAPEDLLNYYPLPSTTTCWTISEDAFSGFPDILEKVGLTKDQAAALLNPQRVVRMNGMVCIFPATSLVVNLAAKERGILYTHLAQWKENEFIANPVFFGRSGVEEWLRGTTLKPNIKALITKLAWKRGLAMVLSDIEAVLAAAESNQEAQEIFRTCTRTRTLMLELVIDDKASIASLGSYWSAGPNKKRTLPFLESMKDAAAESPINCDVCHLFSPLARQILYTYPDLSLAKNGRFPDCHWTSLNFFNHAPRDYYLNTKLAADTVLNDYHKVQEPYGFGDILFFMKEGSALHSCVHIADNIVFTKNGDNVVNPWMLAHLEEVKDVYQVDSTVTIQGFRKNDPEGIKEPDVSSTK